MGIYAAFIKEHIFCHSSQLLLRECALLRILISSWKFVRLFYKCQFDACMTHILAKAPYIWWLTALTHVDYFIGLALLEQLRIIVLTRQEINFPSGRCSGHIHSDHQTASHHQIPVSKCYVCDL